MLVRSCEWAHKVVTGKFACVTVSACARKKYIHYRVFKKDEDDQEGRIHFQQDGAPPHYLGEVRVYLNTRFPGRWIGRAAPIAWPPLSQDLNPLDFFLWGFVKDRLFVPPLLQMSLNSEVELLPQLQK